MARCENLTFGSFNDWRLPTQHDLTQGMLHGLRDLGFKGGGIGINSNNSYFITNVDDHYFWSSTTASTSPISAWRHMADGTTGIALKTSTITSAANHTVLCVRP